MCPASPRRSRRLLTALALTAALVLAACGGDDSTTAASGDASLRVATSIAPFEDLVSQVAGDRAEVSSIVPAGVDGHTYEPTPGDVRILTEVDLLILPDVELNPVVSSLAFDNLPEDAEVVDLNAQVVPEDEVIFADSHSHGDGPSHGHQRNVHTWTNLPYAKQMVGEIVTALSDADPDGADVYEANGEELLAEMDQLMSATQQALATVPDENRTLVVYHDSWSYFGRFYGFDVQGALQAVNFAEPSAAELRTMVQQVQAAGVPAFFGSEVFPTSVLEQVASESGVDYVGNLSDDKLPGEAGDPNHSYIGMMTENVRLIVDGLGGDASALDDVDAA
ncbi:metal ABC transporter substrate-binding protein [Acidimicrobiia bacterium EGI L10123]|uniref:metal ABC transporter substrate-binding protein n=1 Tax=Salinilacustrithrix flava TaxID=2957203 RepID=UPI003D7C220F|nr:metal ABC transporter substrate-binding protein [Acidimicrobiia bacterium EGI L10123]